MNPGDRLGGYSPSAVELSAFQAWLNREPRVREIIRAMEADPELVVRNAAKLIELGFYAGFQSRLEWQDG